VLVIWPPVVNDEDTIENVFDEDSALIAVVEKFVNVQLDITISDPFDFKMAGPRSRALAFVIVTLVSVIVASFIIVKAPPIGA
jgi:hypothetical protein